MSLPISAAGKPFDPGQHICNLDECTPVRVSDGHGGILHGVTGISGVSTRRSTGESIGVDNIMMEPGTAFEIHQHPGDHILYIQSGRGSISVDGIDYPLEPGDTVYVPAEYPHGVSAAVDSGLTFLAFGVPHKHIESADRMQIVS